MAIVNIIHPDIDSILEEYVPTSEADVLQLQDRKADTQVGTEAKEREREKEEEAEEETKTPQRTTGYRKEAPL
ncbi:hypothetical protein N7451_003417 [Penicillium sp. IBT 35674x]|nr:hypothetical protein N7451_003417 [Penicillium sp. IBT 35674x]